MKRGTLVFAQILLLLLVASIPAVAMADGSFDISLSLSETTASVGAGVTASGKTAPEAWVSLKVIDAAGNIVVFDAGKAGASGDYSMEFKIPPDVSGTLTVVVGEGGNVATGTLNVAPVETSGSSGGGGSSTSIPVTSSTGSATVKPGAGGNISLGDEAAVEIPADALTGTGNVEVKVAKVIAPPEAPAGFKLAGSVYEFSIDGETGYSFNKAVTITLSFDPGSLSKGETPAICYYDEAAGRWVKLGGTVSGNTVTVQVDHFTKFAVMAVRESQEQTLTDIAGHWAENSIKELVALGTVNGYPDGSFKPDNTITRAEFATMLVKAFALESKGGKVFADTAAHWAKDYIAAAANGVVNGYTPDTFGPDDLITREQMAAMIVRAAGLTPAAGEVRYADSGSISAWAGEAVATATENGIMTGYPDNTFRPRGNATRAEAVTVIMNTRG